MKMFTWSEALYTLDKRSPSKCRFSVFEVLVLIEWNSPIPHLCHFWNHESVFFQILHHSSFSLLFSSHWTALWFFNSNILYFGKNNPINMLIFLYYFSNDKSIPLQILHHFPLSLHITPLQCFSSYINILWIKGTHQSPIFETF